MIWRSILTEVYGGHSAGRTMMHLKVKSDVEVHGTLLDVGGGRRQTYLKLIDLSKAERFITLDLEFDSSSQTDSSEVLGSVTDLPIRSSSIDTVLCFNLLEHVFDHRAALLEIHRVMTKDAVLYGWVPFIIGVHGAPYDYWRYTDRSLRILLAEAGFVPVKVENRGSTFLAVYDLLRPYYRFSFLSRIARVVLVALALVATWAVSRIAKRVGSPRPWDCPTGIWFIAQRT